MRRIFMTLTAMLIPMAGLTLAFSGTAGAGSLKITCTTVTGTVSGDITISGCTGGNTGGASTPKPTLSLSTGGTTNWVSGSTTTTGVPTTTSVSATKCPGYVKPPKGTTPPEPAALAVSGNVTGDTGDGMLLPATETGEVCVGTDGNTITALKSFVFAWTGSSLTCTTLAGNISSNMTVSGCTGGNTGGGSTPFVALNLATGGTIPWSSGGSTTIARHRQRLPRPPSSARAMSRTRLPIRPPRSSRLW